MVLIPSLNKAISSIEIHLDKERTMPVANFEKKRLSYSNFRKRHMSKVLIILNLLRSYCYGSYSQKEYIEIFIWSRFKVTNERWQMRT
jgi:hypothetical protein